MKEMKNFDLVHFLKSKIGIVAIVGVVLLASVPGYYFYQKYQERQKLLKNPTAAVKAEVKALIAKVEKLIELPKDEEPSVATISDINKLKDQIYFKNAKNGDKLIIYAKNGRAILYRPSTNKIIEAAPFNNQVAQLPTENNTVGKTPTPSPKQLTLTVYNGSDVSGLASTTKQKIEGKFSQIKVTTTGNATGEYSKTSVYDLSGKNKTVASQIAQFLSGEVTTASLSGEIKPQTDLLVIVVE